MPGTHCILDNTSNYHYPVPANSRINFVPVFQQTDGDRQSCTAGSGSKSCGESLSHVCHKFEWQASRDKSVQRWQDDEPVNDQT